MVIEYYTPHDVVQLIAAMIEPFDGTLYDSCCSSGGMFIQSAELVKANNLGETSDSAFTHDLHKGLYFNYVMANPPFNLKGWYDENLKNDVRWSDYTTPPESNANSAWILHILS